MPILTYLKPLDKLALERILTEPKNALIKQYIKLFHMDGVVLSFDKGAIKMIVEKAMVFKLGARGLRSICEVVMLEAMFEFPSDPNKIELKITADYVKTQLRDISLEKLKVA